MSNLLSALDAFEQAFAKAQAAAISKCNIYCMGCGTEFPHGKINVFTRIPFDAVLYADNRCQDCESKH